ncbi:uncharacterized protein [Miscanthus floridulus]|uniref:uncharacterized protein n=1 Tax=Miscanthus floridulus TaxID=154761 RepID=UPI003458BE39
MPTERIILKADNIDGAAEQIIRFLEDSDEGRDVIYFHGSYGFGASAILKTVVERLRSSSGSANTGATGLLGKIIHIDFSRWQSKRALQKAIAEELVLPRQVMALFDKNDEEDDFDGVEQSARGVIPYVKAAIMKELSDCSFLVVLHNGSGSYIDLWEAGVPVIGQLSRRVLWTSRGRFWHHAKDWHGEELAPAELESAKLSDVSIFLAPSPLFKLGQVGLLPIVRNFMYAEAEEVAKYTGVPEPDMTPKIVMECILYRAARDNDHNINWESHASNYWVCDEIIQDAANGGRSAWEIGNALQRNVNWDLCNRCALGICKVLSGEQWIRTNRWVSATSDSENASKFLPCQATSFFWTAAAPSSTIGQNRTRVLEASMFEHPDRSSSLRVIHLSYCNFSFSSPPFLSCNNLRILMLDHCKDQDAQDRGEEKEYHHRSNCSQQDGGACFRNLWVLELSYTDWYWLLSKDMLDLMVDLRELHVKGFGNRSMNHLHRCSGAGSNSRRLIMLRMVVDGSNKASDNDDDGTSGDRNEQVSPPPVVAALSFPDLSSWHILKTVVLDGCGDLELIAYNSMPLSLESFTLISNVATKIKSISFRGCAKLKSLLLRGLFYCLVELDISGTSIKTLDLSATQAKHLKRLFLLGCEELRAIQWPMQEPTEYRKVWLELELELLCIDTTTTTTRAAWGREEEGKSNKQQEATASDSASIRGSSSATMCGKEGRTLIDSDLYISVRDPRVFRSLLHLRPAKRLQVDISSTSITCGPRGTTNQGIGNKQQVADVNVHCKPAGNMYVDDVIISTPASNGSSSQADCANTTDVSEMSVLMKSMWLWHCPPAPTGSDWAKCYISIQDDETRTGLLPQGTTTTTRQLTRAATTLPHLVSDDAKTLHLHDSLSITCLPGPAPAAAGGYLDWVTLKWCRLERCPNLEGVVFATPPERMRRLAAVFCDLQTFWASQLPKTRYIWDWSPLFHHGYHSFEHLAFLLLDYCPRLALSTLPFEQPVLIAVDAVSSPRWGGPLTAAPALQALRTAHAVAGWGGGLATAPAWPASRMARASTLWGRALAAALSPPFLHAPDLLRCPMAATPPSSWDPLLQPLRLASSMGPAPKCGASCSAATSWAACSAMAPSPRSTTPATSTPVLDKEKALYNGLVPHIKREIAILRRVHHPNAVRLFKVMATKRKIYFVMEFVLGGELFARVAKGARIFLNLF